MIFVRPRIASHMIVFLALSMLFGIPGTLFAQQASSCGAAGTSAGAITLDSNFSDWAGQPCVPDPVDDCDNNRADLVSLFFASPPNDSNIYFMAETAAGANQPLGLRIQIDTNNDGIYTSAVDRIILVRYQAKQNDSEVEVDLLDGQEEDVAEIARGADWGESRLEGSNRVEWGVSLAQLGVQAGQPIRMLMQSRGGSANGNSWCDTTQEIQWSPADALGPVLLLVIGLSVAFVAARLRGRRV